MGRCVRQKSLENTVRPVPSICKAAKMGNMNGESHTKALCHFPLTHSLPSQPRANTAVALIRRYRPAWALRPLHSYFLHSFRTLLPSYHKVLRSTATFYTQWKFQEPCESAMLANKQATKQIKKHRLYLFCFRR